MSVLSLFAYAIALLGDKYRIAQEQEEEQRRTELRRDLETIRNILFRVFSDHLRRIYGEERPQVGSQVDEEHQEVTLTINTHSALRIRVLAHGHVSVSWSSPLYWPEDYTSQYTDYPYLSVLGTQIELIKGLYKGNIEHFLATRKKDKR